MELRLANLLLHKVGTKYFITQICGGRFRLFPKALARSDGAVDGALLLLNEAVVVPRAVVETMVDAVHGHRRVGGITDLLSLPAATRDITLALLNETCRPR